MLPSKRVILQIKNTFKLILSTSYCDFNDVQPEIKVMGATFKVAFFV